MKINKKWLLYRLLSVIFQKLVDDDEDGLYIIVGREGVGKSRFMLYLIHIYLLIKNGKVRKSDIKHIGLTPVDWTLALKNAKKGDPNVYDEASEFLNSKDGQGAFVKMAEKTYQVIRGDNLLSLLVLPDLYLLPPYFRYHRVRGLFVVEKRGRFRFWDKERLDKLMVYNDKRSRPYRRWNIFSLFRSSFPNYDGVLLKPYLEMKASKMSDSRDSLYRLAKSLESDEADYNVKGSDALYKTISSKVFKDYSKGVRKADLVKKFKTSHITINRAITYQVELNKVKAKKLKQTERELSKLK